MSFDECKNLALKYHVEDIPSALMQGTSLSRLLRELEASTISKISHHFLNKKKFLALEKLAHGIISFEEYESLAPNSSPKCDTLQFKRLASFLQKPWLAA